MRKLSTILGLTVLSLSVLVMPMTPIMARGGHGGHFGGGHFGGFHSFFGGHHSSGGDDDEETTTRSGLHSTGDDDDETTSHYQSPKSIASSGIHLNSGHYYYYPGTHAYYYHNYSDNNNNSQSVSDDQQASNANYLADAKSSVIQSNVNLLSSDNQQTLIHQDIQYQKTNLQPRIFFTADPQRVMKSGDHYVAIGESFDQKFAEAQTHLNYARTNVNNGDEYASKNNNGALIYVLYSGKLPTQVGIYLDGGLKSVIPQSKIDALLKTNHQALSSTKPATVNQGISKVNLGLTQLIWQYKLKPALTNAQNASSNSSLNNDAQQGFATLVIVGTAVSIMAFLYLMKKRQQQ